MKIAAWTVWLVLRECAMALSDPKPHDHTEPHAGRCTRCGHRIPTTPDEVVRETRTLPLRKQFSEPIGRAMARRHGLLAA